MTPGRGESAVVVPVPAAEPVVSAWRARYDASAAQGMPAHVTALYPFLDQDRLTAPVLAQLAGLCARLPVLDVEFRGTARFPGVLYLAPSPADGLRRLTVAIVERWPEAPPYGGVFDAVVPHLTVAHGVDAAVLGEVERAVAGGLPVRARLPAARLYVFDGELWRARARLPFGG